MPTNIESFEKETIETIEQRFESLWNCVTQRGIDRELLIRRSLLSPATCCLINPDLELTVEKSFVLTRTLSGRLRQKYDLV